MAFELNNVDKGSVEKQWGSGSSSSSLLESFETDKALVEQDAIIKSGLENPDDDQNVKKIDVDSSLAKESLLEKTIEKEEVNKETAASGSDQDIDDNVKSAINALVEEGIIDGFDNYEIKTLEDVKDLIKENIKDKTSAINENIFQETLQQLPPQFQSIIKYGLNGGQDINSLLQSWANVEKVYNIDTTTDGGKEEVVREYLTLSNYGTPEMIEQDIKTWKDLGTLEAKANIYKPQLESYHMQQVAAKEQEAQEEILQKQQYFEAYTQEVGKVLSQADLNGLPLDKATRQYLYENVQPIYQSQLTGEPIDALQAVVEELKFGENANPAFYSELALFATNPELYKDLLRNQLRTELAISKEKTLRKKVQSDISGISPELDKKSQPRRDSQTW